MIQAIPVFFDSASPKRNAALRAHGAVRTFLLAALMLGSCAGIALAQNGAAQETAPANGQDGAVVAVPNSAFGEVVDVRVVNVDVYVEGRNGEPVLGLSQGEFELEVDGKPMEITNFRAEVDGTVRESVRAIARPTQDDSFRPLDEIQTDPERRAHVVLYVDNTRLNVANRERAFRAVRGVLGRLDPDDMVAVVSLGSSLVFHSDFLFDRQAVGEILDEIEKNGKMPNLSEIERRQIFGLLARGQSGGVMAQTNLNGDDVLARIRAYAAEEYQHSIQGLRALDQVVGTVAGVPGRKIVLYVGEGIPTRPGEGMYSEWTNRTGSSSDIGVGLPHVNYNRGYSRDVGNYDLERPLEQVAARANDSGVTLYAVDAEGDHGGMIRSALTEQGAHSEAVTTVTENYRAPLEFATQATGGKLLRSSGTLTEQLTGMVRDFNTFYSIGFSQPKDWEPGSEHDIKVNVAGRGRRTRHRDMVRVPVIGEAEARAVVAALMYQTLENPLGIKANPGTEAPRDDGTVALPVLVEIPVKKLATVPQGTTQAISLTLYVATKDAEGNPRPVQRIPFHLDIPNDKIEEARANSAFYTLPVVLRKGDRQAVVGVRDDLSGVFSVVRLDVGQFTQSL